MGVESRKTPTQRELRRRESSDALRAENRTVGVLPHIGSRRVDRKQVESLARGGGGGFLVSRARETRSGEEAGPAWDVSAHESCIGRISAFG